MLLISLLLIPLYAAIFIPVFILLFLTLTVVYLIRSSGNPHSLLAIIAGMVLPLGMLILLLKKIWMLHTI